MKDKKMLLFFILSMVFTIIILFLSFFYWEVVEPIRNDPYYEEPIPDNFFRP